MTYVKKLLDRKAGWQPLIIFIIITFLFSRTIDPVPLLGDVNHYFGISAHVVKMFLSIPLLILLIVLWLSNNQKLQKIVVVFFVVTELFFLFLYVFKLVNTIDAFTGDEGAYDLFNDVIAVWFINVLIFSLIYFTLDNRGPFNNSNSEGKEYDLLFPQYTLKNEIYKNWRPYIIDYVTLSFSTCSTFGPTDTLFLSRNFKIIMIIQTVISLSILTVLATRAVTLIK